MDTVTTKPPMHQLPYELWMAITEFMDPDDLRKYIGIHRVFYELVMDLRYSELELRDLRPSPLFKIIDNLRNPDVAGRVRILTIWPIAVRTAIHDVSRPPQERVPHPLLREIIKLLRRLRPRRRVQISTPTPEDQVEERYRSVGSAGQGLTRVETLNIHWPRGEGSTDPLDETLFSAIQPIFSSNLQTLLLEMPLMVLAKAYAHITDLPCLRELDLTLSVDRAGVEFKESHKDAVTKALVPFINGVSSSLRALSITIHNHLDLSPLFRDLGNFHQLKRLILIIPFDLYHISDPSGFNRLLCNHPDLKELYIRHQSCCRSHESPSLVDGNNWVEKCFRGVSFTGLKTLSLGLTNAFHLKFANAMAPLAQSLMSLILTPLLTPIPTPILTEPPLRYDDVDRVLMALATPQLSSLSLFVDVLTPQLLVLFAEKCPNLEQLDLNIEKCRRFDEGPHDEAGFIRAFEADYIYRHELYDTWKLRKIVIWMWIYGEGRKRQLPLMRAIADKVPTLTKRPENGGELQWPYTLD